MTTISGAPRGADRIRRWAGERSPQPYEDALVVSPPSDSSWVYGPGQYEAALLARIVSDGHAVNRHVDYPANFAPVAAAVRLAATATAGGVLELRVAGRVVAIEVDGAPLDLDPSEVAAGSIRAVLSAAGAVLCATIEAGDGTAPALAVAASAPVADWLGSLDDGASWQPAAVRPGGRDAPHLRPVGSVSLTAAWAGCDGTGAVRVFDVGAPLLGRPVLPAGPRPTIGTGESVEEALADPARQESRHEVEQLPDGKWTTVHELGFRYVAVRGADIEAVSVEASVAVVDRPGAFACSDETLTRIWAAASYTLRACTQGLVLDGIKRDRMPWAGDQALSILANAFALGLGGTAADGLVALGQPVDGYVNGIADYSLWWVISAEYRLRCFGDLGFAAREAEHLDAFVAELATHAGIDGVLRTSTQFGGFPGAGAGSVFLDWHLELDQGRDAVALQMLWLLALRSAAQVLEAVGRGDAAARWRVLADRTESTLRTRAWMSEEGRWSDYVDGRGRGRVGGYANFLAVLAGLHDGTPVPDGVVAAVLDATTGTPFMSAMRLRALAGAGRMAEMLGEIRSEWGRMLELGPGTFWEEAGTDEPLAMYGRPFGRSRCHAWASGPAAVLPEAVLGLRSLAPGWTRFEVRPELAELEWASAVVPVPTGDLVVVADAVSVRVEVPAGCVLVRDGREVPGPASVEWWLTADAEAAPIA
ncbi:hypothetical protein [Agromyces seonyuensis]|uniref:Family 78 glycoside hydrolase catalytic domain n=1 Tax=Agromyces seonyuensis TaxID=2662446 RepID=A0A6I4NXA6_9MICO|nr:hypothetical protein [Agromyces seonyuensis]MWB97145.1 family 78 glycoside hydrolase catalytic domain [Agromyces seonyuensis]